MRITERQLRQIIREETVYLEEEKLDQFNEEVREAYFEQVLLTYPNTLFEHGYISEATWTRARKMRMLTESGRRDYALEEGFFDDVKALAAKAKEKLSPALAKGKEKAKAAGKAALAKAKEIGDTEIDVKKATKDMKRVGKEAGELTAGTGEAILNFLGPISDKLGGKAVKFAGKVVNKIGKMGIGALTAIPKASVAVINKALKTAGGTVKGTADLMRKTKDGLTYEKMANEDPKAFMAMYRGLQREIKGLKMRGVTTPKQVEATLGVFKSPEGQKALEAASKKTGKSAEEIEALMGLFVFQTRYVAMATKAAKTKKKPTTRKKK